MESKHNKIFKITKWFLILLLVLVVIWFCFTTVEFYRAKSDKRPLVCSKMKKDVENNEEYSLTCYGILYKYREYYSNEDDSMTGREFTLFFKEFKREVANYETK